MKRYPESQSMQISWKDKIQNKLYQKEQQRKIYDIISLENIETWKDTKVTIENLENIELNSLF